MCDEKIIIEVNSRTKEKKTIKATDLQLTDDLTMQDLIDEVKLLQKQLKSLIILNKKLVDVVASINVSTAVQIADIKEEIK